ncbi:hypothetical protein FB45DRAFT_940140 [Roridomyces roridus]|uniref:Opine dehydrogenase domain-containing protein n=1 Tax=Roridomyces roridus TaxID=1738132 RepID=A0AAD7FCN9_9AGAR|nr:hypothetical protein FB45DRAFT_940140 [Roridomyces roridus]
MHPFLPSSLEHRYIASDVAHGLQFFVELAQVVGVEVPVFKAVVTLAGAVTRTNHAITGTTLASFGLDRDKATLNDIRALFTAGEIKQ